MVVGTHFTRASDVIVPDFLTAAPAIEIAPYRDMFGNWRSRMVAPAGRVRLGADGMVRDRGLPDPVSASAMQHAVEDLPSKTLMAAAIARPTSYPISPGNCSRRLRLAGLGFRQFVTLSIVTSYSAMSMLAQRRRRYKHIKSARASAATTRISPLRPAAV